MKKIIRKISAVLICCLAVSSVMTARAENEALTVPAVRGEKLTDTAAAEGNIDAPKTDDGVELAIGKTVSVTFGGLQPGDYGLAAEYSVPDAGINEATLNLTAGKEKSVICFPVLWQDAEKTYPLDKKGNETNPEQTAYSGVCRYAACNHSDINHGKKTIRVNSDTLRLSLQSVGQKLIIKRIFLVKSRELPAYDEYAASFGKITPANRQIIVEGEKYADKSQSFIRAKAIKNQALYPYDSRTSRINVLNGATWKSAGDTVSWNFEVEEDGYYALSMRYAQYSTLNKPSWRRIELDGAVPFAELAKAQIPATAGETSFENFTFVDKDGKPYYFYLAKGEHTISMTVVLGDSEQIYYDLKAVIDTVNDLGMALTRLTAGLSDSNRTWDMEKTYPEAIPTLESCVKKIDAIYAQAQKITGDKPGFVNDLLHAKERIKKALDDPQVIPANTDMINVGDNSASKYLSSALSNLLNNPLTLDRFYLGDGDTEKLPKTKSGFLKSFAEGLRSFLRSFISTYSDAYAADISTAGQNALNIWVNRSVQYVDVMQKMIDRMDESYIGMPINLSIMPSEQKLVLANAAGTSPDLALCVGSGTVFNLAIRGAAQNLMEFEDFIPTYGKNYSLENLVTLGFDGGAYGATELMDFKILYYRTDIFNELNLKVPDTWDDVRELLPTLLRYKMNICLPISAAGGYKGYGTTVPFLYQNGAALFSEDGTATLINSDEAYRAFKEMINLFTVYGLKQSVPSAFNSFKYGETPIVMAGIDFYLQLTVAAPELAGSWDIALCPGTKKENGIDRCQTSAGSAAMMFKSSAHKEEAWKFLKWWLSEETQTTYAYEMATVYGSEFFWCTANLNSFASLPLVSDAHKKLISEQLSYQREIPCHPANYIVEREISNIWNSVVINKDNLADTVDNAVSVVNREIVRKLQLFGYVDDSGKVIKPYKIFSVSDIKQ